MTNSQINNITTKLCDLFQVLNKMKPKVKAEKTEKAKFVNKTRTPNQWDSTRGRILNLETENNLPGSNSIST